MVHHSLVEVLSVLSCSYFFAELLRCPGVVCTVCLFLSILAFIELFIFPVADLDLLERNDHFSSRYGYIISKKYTC